MTKVSMYWQKLRIEIEGHAGYAEKGNDIVCAAESMLAYALAGVLEDAQQRGRTGFRHREGDGRMVLSADPNMGSSQEIKAYFRMAVMGFRMLREQYPQHIEIREVM